MEITMEKHYLKQNKKHQLQTSAYVLPLDFFSNNAYFQFQSF